MAKAQKNNAKWLHIPASWKKVKPSPWESINSGWRLTWGKRKTRGGVCRVWPAECTECGKGLQVQLRGMACRTFAMKKDGEFGKQVGPDDVDIHYENPIFVCSDSKCSFEYEVEE